jgi:AraC family transcriptional regulator of arabinose operon
MIRVFRRDIPGALDLAGNALEEALLWANVVASKNPWMSMDDRVRKAADYLVANLREPFRLENLARHCGASVSRLAHLFKEQTGSSPQQYLERHRMQHAGRLLRLTSLGIGEIAAEVGYEDPFYFSNRFRRHSGKSPSQYRGQRPGSAKGPDR